MPTPNFNISDAHRWFAIKFNNRSWDLIELNSCTSDELNELLDAAHASSFHWKQIGKTVNQVRGQTLLVMAYVKAELGESAVWYAERLHKLFSFSPEGLTAFDSASVHGAIAAAYRLANNTSLASEHDNLAREYADMLTQPADRELFFRLFPSCDA